MSKDIIDSALKRGAYVNERTSIHMHALASYYGKVFDDQEAMGIPMRVSELERDMPEIILANLHQLVRRFQNAMTWMTMGLDEPNRLTRWEKFRVSVIPHSAVMNHMTKVRDDIMRGLTKSKYGWINYNPVGFNPKTNDINRFHVEFRAAECLLCPSAVAAIACMYYALIIKAVDISRYGVLEIGDDKWLEQTEEVKNALMNNVKDWNNEDRFSDTRNLHRYHEILISESMELVHQLKAVLIKVGPAYEVLEKLAERPVALRRVEGQTWEKIEKDLEVILTEEGKFDVALSEIITLNQVSDCDSMVEWVKEVSQVLRADPGLDLKAVKNEELTANVADFVERKQEDGKLVWSSRIKAPIMI